MTGAEAADGGPRRFVPPLRAAVDRAAFDHPLFAGIAGFGDLLTAADWPRVVDLDARLALPGKRFVEQDAALLADGLHYETRIAEGRIATRAGNWHDLFNALVWARYLPIKCALNAQQCRHIEGMAAGQRNRAQAALTQFDEAGVVVRVCDPALLAAWDAHQWRVLFEPIHWQSGRIAIVAVFGHALMEQALLPGRLLVGKCVVLQGDDEAGCIDTVARAIEEGRVLLDPLELRPLPLAGIPGWHTDQAPAFYANDDYFRPLREGRRYPPPLL